MENAALPLDIRVACGEPDGLQNLIDIDAEIDFGKEYVESLKEQAKFTKDLKQDFHILIKLHVVPGREKQGEEYFIHEKEPPQEILDTLSPLQRLLLKRPIQQEGKCKISAEAGCVFIRYRFYLQANQTNKEIDEFYQGFGDKLRKINSSISLKGYLSHNKKNRTNVKVDYAKFTLNSAQMRPKDFSLAFKKIIDDDEITTNPLFSSALNLKRVNLNFSLNSFREMRSVFFRLTGAELPSEKKEFHYVNQGIFRKKFECYFIYKKIGGIKVIGNYESEDAFIRLIKVYGKMAMKIFDFDIEGF